MSRNPKVSYSDWVAIDRKTSQNLGESPLNTNRELRITWLALARLEPQRHAHFAVGELQQLLGVLVDKDTGLVKLPDRSSVHRSIAALIESGFLRSDSNSRCLVVNMNIADYARAATGRDTRCPNLRRAAA